MKTLYRCLRCGAICVQRVWAALDVAKAEERCPGCGKWSGFEAVDQAGQVKPVFGQKNEAA